MMQTPYLRPPYYMAGGEDPTFLSFGIAEQLASSHLYENWSRNAKRH